MNTNLGRDGAADAQDPAKMKEAWPVCLAGPTSRGSDPDTLFGATVPKEKLRRMQDGMKWALKNDW